MQPPVDIGAGNADAAGSILDDIAALARSQVRSLHPIRVLAAKREPQSSTLRLADSDVLAVRLSDPELPKTVRRVIDRAVDGGSPFLHFRIDLLNIVHPEYSVRRL